MSINVPKELNWKKENPEIVEVDELVEDKPKVELGPDAPMIFSKIWQEILTFGNSLLESYSDIYGAKTLRIADRFQEKRYQLVELDKNNELIVMKQSEKGYTEDFFFVQQYSGNFPEFQKGKEEQVQEFFKFYAQKKSLVGPLKK